MQDAYHCSVILSLASTIVLEIIPGVDRSEKLIGVNYVSETALKFIKRCNIHRKLSIVPDSDSLRSLYIQGSQSM